MPNTDNVGGRERGSSGGSGDGDSSGASIFHSFSFMNNKYKSNHFLIINHSWIPKLLVLPIPKIVMETEKILKTVII
jgi:hypothetical protein